MDARYLTLLVSIVLTGDYCCRQSASPHIVPGTWYARSFRDIPESVLGCRLWCVVGGSQKKPVRKRQLADCACGEQVLAKQRTGRVRQVVGDAQSAHPFGDLGQPITRQVRVEVMFDLVAEVSTHERQYPPSPEVCGPQHLPEIPLGLRLTLQHCRRELFRSVREVTAEDHYACPHVAQSVGNHVGQECAPPPPATQRRKENIVLASLASHLTDERCCVGGFAGIRRLAILHCIQAV